jgi:hypothetical protein
MTQSRHKKRNMIMVLWFISNSFSLKMFPSIFLIFLKYDLCKTLIITLRYAYICMLELCHDDI